MHVEGMLTGRSTTEMVVLLGIVRTGPKLAVTQSVMPFVCPRIGRGEPIMCTSDNRGHSSSNGSVLQGEEGQRLRK
jgi:hypothetical protein